MVTIQITKRHLFLLVATLFVGVVIAYGGNDPATMGHTAGEMHVQIGSTTKTLQEAINQGDLTNNEGYTLLMGSKDWTEEALFTINPSGFSFETDAQYSDQLVNPIAPLTSWPADAEEIVLEVENIGGDDFCVAGNGTGSRTIGQGQNAKCTVFRYRGQTMTRTTSTQDDWVQIYINGKKMVGCPSTTGRVPVAGYPGTYGHPAHGVICTYGNAAWTGPLQEIRVETADWSGSYSSWDWKVWYR